MVDGETITPQGVKPRPTESCFVIYHSEGCSSCGFLQLVFLLITCIAALRDQEKTLGHTDPATLYSKFKRENKSCPKGLKLFKPMQRDSWKIVLNRRKYGCCSSIVMQLQSIGPCKTSKEAAQ